MRRTAAVCVSRFAFRENRKKCLTQANTKQTLFMHVFLSQFYELKRPTLRMEKSILNHLDFNLVFSRFHLFKMLFCSLDERSSVYASEPFVRRYSVSSMLLRRLVSEGAAWESIRCRASRIHRNEWETQHKARARTHAQGKRLISEQTNVCTPKRLAFPWRSWNKPRNQLFERKWPHVCVQRNQTTDICSFLAHLILVFQTNIDRNCASIPMNLTRVIIEKLNRWNLDHCSN